MIIIQLQGGLGNQMFQYACGKNLAILNNVELKLDISFLEKNKIVHTKRNFELKIFNFDTKIAKDRDIKIFDLLYENKIIKHLHKKFPFSNYNLIKEKSMEYKPEIFTNLQKFNRVIGFWQSEKYFKENEYVIRNDFKFKKLPNNYNQNFIKIIENKTTVGLHVRRGDYVTNESANLFHGVMKLKYYRDALQIISNKINNFQLFIFSDDPEWVQNNFDFDVETFYVKENIGDESYNDLHLMSLCDHLIIANSSFSWWGAWLNEKPYKIVIAPKKWFLNLNTNTKDLIPESWIQI